jgi:predicted oxidoreductase
MIKKYNKEEAERQTALQEIWNHILEFIANHKIIEKLFNFDGTEYNPDNIAENNSENNNKNKIF